MHIKKIISGLSALVLGIQTLGLNTIVTAIGESSANDGNNLVEITLNELGTQVDLKIQVNGSDNYSELYNYNDLSINSNGNKVFYVPNMTDYQVTFIDAKGTEAINDDAVISIIENLDNYSSLRGKYKLDGVYQSYELTFNPITENRQASVSLDTYVNGDINLDGQLRSNDLLILKQRLLFEYNIIQTGAYEQGETGGNVSISGKNNTYANNLTINGDLFADNSIYLGFDSGNINGKLSTSNGKSGNDIFNINVNNENVSIADTENSSITLEGSNTNEFYLNYRSNMTYFDLNEDILLTDEDVNSLYFSNDIQVEEVTEITEQNLNINDDRSFANDITFNTPNSMNLNASIKAEGDITINGEVHNSNNAIIYSKQNITISNDSTFSFTGMIYAPNGTVTINANNVNINGCVIAKNIIINADTVNFNVNSLTKYENDNTSKVLTDLQLFLADMNNDGIADDKDLMIMKRILLHLDPDETYIPYEEWSTLEDSDSDGIPDIFNLENWGNLNDWDEDGIPDSVESYYGTHRYIKDTDNDGLSDYEELFYTYTDPLIYDSLVEGVSDGELDLDEDGLNNTQEMKYNTNPLLRDSDNDGLNDFDELFPNHLYSQREKTDPLNPDTNNNGILDGDEKAQQNYIQRIENDVITEISIEGSFSKDISETTSITSIADKDMLCANVVGLVGEPFEIATTSTFDTSTITFTVDSSKLDGKTLDDLLLLWYDEENDNFVELNTKVNTENSTISVNTTHFSKYMIVDKQEWFNTWENAPNYLDTTLYVPYDVAICVDCSGSMEENDPNFDYSTTFPEIYASSLITDTTNNTTNYRNLSMIRFIWSMQKGDRTAIINYTNTPLVKCDLTSIETDLGRNTLLSAIDATNSGGNNVSNALIKAQEILKNSTNRAIILLTDGEDVDNISTQLKESLKNSSNLKIYAIGLGKGKTNLELENLANATGGEFFSTDKAIKLQRIFDNILSKQCANIPWIDKDKDGIPDEIESKGLICSNGQTFKTNPNNCDTDGDGLLDGEEIKINYSIKHINGVDVINSIYFKCISNPESVNSDGDEIDDYREICKTNTNPLSYNLFLDLNEPELSALTQIGWAKDTENNTLLRIWITKEISDYREKYNKYINLYYENENFKNDILILDLTNSTDGINYQVYNSYLYTEHNIIIDTVNAIQKYNNTLKRTEWERTTDGLYLEWIEHNILYSMFGKKGWENINIDCIQKIISDFKTSAKHADLDQFANGTILGEYPFNYYEKK